MTTSCMYNVGHVLSSCVPVLVPRVTAGSPSSRLQRVSGPGDTLPTAPPPLIVYTCKESNLEIDRIENIKYI